MKSLICFILSITFVFASRLHVVKSPSYLKYDYSKDSLKLSELSDLILLTNGFSTSDIEWSGLTSESTLKTPKVTLILTTSDQNAFENNFDDKLSIKIIDDDDKFNFESISQAYSKQFGPQNSSEMTKLIDELSNDHLKDLKTTCALNPSLVYLINLDKIHESNLIKSIDTVVNKFYEKCASSENTLVYLLLLGKSSDLIERSRRELNARNLASNGTKPFNEALFYNENYAVTFNILFWTCLFLALAIVGITCSIWNMDPGSDTVIYRMTSQRIKKDQ